MNKEPMPEILSKLISEVGKLYRTDETRVYLTGFSYGGTCTWQIAEQIPDRFAAIVPISARAMEDPAKTARILKDVAVYTGCGTAEWSMPMCKQMRDAFEASGHPRFVYRQFEGGTHWSYPLIYTDPEFWKWLLAQRRTIKATTRP
jgi:predicted peptidase